MNKKKILSLALVVIMIAILSFSSLAWFTDKDSAKNDFTIGGAGQNDPEKIFSVDVKENVDGEAEPVDEIKFEDILPGDNHKKEAYVSNTGAYEQYIRVVMTITDWNQIKDVVSIKMDEQFNDTWHIYNSGVYVDADGYLKPHANANVNADGALVVTMFLNSKLAVSTEAQIMDMVSVSADATQEDFVSENFADGFQITFDADAAQTKNILSAYDEEEWKNAMATFKALEG